MINFSIINQVELIAFWLCFTRWTAVMMQLPMFDNNSVPMVVKVLTSILISYVFFPIVQGPITQDILAVGVDNFWLLTVFHTMVGLVLGFLVKSIMSIFMASGSLMTQQMGFTSVSYFDPTFVSRVGPIEKIIQWTILIMILSSGALLPMFKGVLHSFIGITWVSVGKFSTTPEYFQLFFKYLFGTALMLATPILFSNLLLNLVLGIVARTIPQMNVLMVSFVVNIGLGLLIFIAISEEYFAVAYKIYVDQLGQWFQFVAL